MKNTYIKQLGIILGLITAAAMLCTISVYMMAVVNQVNSQALESWGYAPDLASGHLLIGDLSPQERTGFLFILRCVTSLHYFLILFGAQVILIVSAMVFQSGEEKPWKRIAGKLLSLAALVVCLPYCLVPFAVEAVGVWIGLFPPVDMVPPLGLLILAMVLSVRSLGHWAKLKIAPSQAVIWY